MAGYYKLNGKTPVPCRDVIEWAQWYETADRRVDHSDLGGGIEVSTVFLGLDHDHSGKGPPILFETMVFTNGSGGDMDRYATWDEAVAGHARMVEKVKLSN